MTGAEDVREEVFRAIARGIANGVSADQLDAILDDAHDRVDRVRVFQDGGERVR